MSDTMREILEKVQKGEITPAEGERLLDELAGETNTQTDGGARGMYGSIAGNFEGTSRAASTAG